MIGMSWTNSLPSGQGLARGSHLQKQDMVDMVGVIRHWGETLVKWPVAVDENNGPRSGWL